MVLTLNSQAKHAVAICALLSGLISCGAQAADSLSYPATMPAWLSESFEICHHHMISESEASSILPDLITTYGWKTTDAGNYPASLGKWQSFSRDDGGRYVYSLMATRMTFGPEEVTKCHILRQSEPWKIPLPEKEFSSISEIEGVAGKFEIFKPCETCPEIILGQWAWTIDKDRFLISGQSDPSSSISILITSS